MKFAYDVSYTPPVPVLSVRLAAPGEAARVGPLAAIADTGSDGTLIPSHYLEMAEAIDLGDVLLSGVLGESREAHLFEIDIHVDGLVLPSVAVVGDDQGEEVILGRNLLNKLILLLDGQRQETELFEGRPRWR